MNTVVETHLPELELVARGKVRDIYTFEDKLLLIATDRISAFDCILPQPIPDKGKVLHQISSFWFDWSRPWVRNHLFAERIDDFPEELKLHREQLRGRSALVHHAEMFPVECVARGYICGSGWKDYQASGAVCGIRLPAGLRLADRLPEAIFTPATKAESGHDENISYAKMVDLVGQSTASRLKELTLSIYAKASELALEKGIVIADTKFEFGVIDGEIALCDEMLTPDSSRFWPRELYSPGKNQPSFDKQYVRDYLESIAWDKTPPPPDLPQKVVEGSRRRYLEILEILTGHGLRDEPVICR